jgi:lysozyme family protein
MSFALALAFSIKEEGGYSDNPADVGGPTNHGVTQSVYDSYRDTKKLPHQSVQLITDAETSELYENMYWEPSHAQVMKSPLDACHFDWSVNHGITGAIRTLQQALGIPTDGIWGSKTALAIQLIEPAELAQEYNKIRRQWYQNRVISKPDQQQFLAGWLARVDRLDAYCETL